VCSKRKNLFEKTFANKLRPQTSSTGFSDNWANQCRESVYHRLTSWWNLPAPNLQTTLVFRSAFKAISVFLKPGHSGKMGKTKKDTNARVAGRRKQIKASTAEQLCMDNISTSLNDSSDSSISDSSGSLITSLLLLLIFFICVVHFRWCIFIPSSLSSLFGNGPCF